MTVTVEREQPLNCCVCGTSMEAPGQLCAKCNSFQVHKPCKVCKYPIPEEARRCNRCQSHQNFFVRMWERSNATLALISAITSTAALGLTHAATLLERSPEVTVAFLSAEDGYVLADISNTGGAPAVIRECRLQFHGLPINDALLVLLIDPKIPGGKIVRAGQDLRLKLEVRELSWRAASGPRTRAEILERFQQAPVTLEIWTDGQRSKDTVALFYVQKLLEARLSEEPQP